MTAVASEAHPAARVAVLAEEVHLVAKSREGGHEAGVVDVGAGPPQEVAVEDENAQRL